SGSAPVRSPNELPGCVSASPTQNPNTALFRSEAIKVPLADPTNAATGAQPRILAALTEAATHGAPTECIATTETGVRAARPRGPFVSLFQGQAIALPPTFTAPLLDSIVKARNGSGSPTAADSNALRGAIDGIVARLVGQNDGSGSGPRPGPNQCHD